MKRLKANQPSFRMNSGKFKGRLYEKGVSYPEQDIPKGMSVRFENVPALKKPAVKKAAAKKETTK